MSKQYSVVANLIAKTGDFVKGINEAKNSTGNFLKDFNSTVDKIGKKSKELGAGFSKYVTAPLIAIGGIAIANATQFEKATATIRAGTGAIGEDLANLENDFKEVFKGVPQSASEVSQALADLNTRTGLTGEPLQELTKQLLNLSRVSGTEVTSLVASTTRVFGDWGIETENTAETLDYLWKVSQSTGIGIDQLSQKMVQFGAPLRQVGFSFEESAALMGKWEKEGVNTELVLGSLRIALGNFARDGIDVREGLEQTIESIKNAGSVSEATALAMEVFGSRAGADMAAAIREGRFEIDDLINTLDASQETINQAGKETLTFGERLATIKNQASVGLEPLGSILLNIAEEWLPQVSSGIEKVSNWFNNLSPSIQKSIVVVGLLIGGIGPLLVILGTLITAVGTLGAVIGGLSLPIVAIIAGIAGFIAILVTAYNKVDWFRELVDKSFEKITGSISSFASSGKELINQFLETAFKLWDRYGNNILDIVQSILSLIIEVFTTTFDIITNLIKITTSILRGDWRRALEGIKKLTSLILNGVINIFSRSLDVLKNISQTGLRIITDIFKGLFNQAVQWGSSIIDGLLRGISNLASQVRNTVTNFIQTNITDRIKSALKISSPSKLMEEYGEFVSLGLAKGITGEDNKVTSAVEGIANRINSLKDFINTDLSFSVTGDNFDLLGNYLGGFQLALPDTGSFGGDTNYNTYNVSPSITLNVKDTVDLKKQQSKIEDMIFDSVISGVKKTGG